MNNHNTLQKIYIALNESVDILYTHKKLLRFIRQENEILKRQKQL